MVVLTNVIYHEKLYYINGYLIDIGFHFKIVDKLFHCENMHNINLIIFAKTTIKVDKDILGKKKIYIECQVNY
jgi:hypothetical protein